MKKLISGILGVTVAASMAAGLSGCEKTGGNNTLLWYMLGDKPADHELVMEKANEIIEPKIGMKLNIEYIDGASFNEKMKMKMASQEAYDLAFTGYTNQYHTAVALGGLYDITELIKETELDKVIPEYYLQTATVNGKIYGIPNIQVISNPSDLEIFKSVADDCGIEELFKEIDELSNMHASYSNLEKLMGLYSEMFAKIKEKRPDLYTWNPSGNLASNPIYEEVVAGVGFRRDGTSNEFVLLHETDEWKLGVNSIRDWYKKGYIRNDIASKGNALTDAEEIKQVAVRCGTWKPGQEVYIKNMYDEDYIYAWQFNPYVSRTSALLTMISVGGNTKHPKEAVEMIKLLNTDKELFNLICWGIEDKHYTKNEDGTVSEIKDSGYDGVGQNAWKYGNQFNGFVAEGQPSDVWEQTEKMNNEADKSPMIGFVLNTDSIETELANITNVNAEYKARIEFGTEDMSVWYDEYSKKLEQANIKKVRDEIQRQYDEWLEGK